MQRLTLLLLLILCAQTIFGQNQLPTINATSDYADIRVGDDYFAKGGWRLEPDKKPDIFSIGSKWTYTSKRVTFITDVDSISFDVQPGNTYNFVILLHQKPCYIQIVTRPDPVFMNAKIVIPILIGFTIIVALVYLRRDRINVLHLLTLGYIVPPLFWLIIFTSGYIHGNYNHFKNVISELGAIGTKSEIITSSSFLVLALLSTLFSIGFYKASKELTQSTIPAILSFSKPISMAWAAIFTLGNEFHGLMGPLPLLIILGSLLTFLLWKKDVEFLMVRVLSLLSFFIMLLILLRFVKPFGIQYEGLVQRFFYLGWTVWIISTTYFLSKKIRYKKIELSDTFSISRGTS